MLITATPTLVFASVVTALDLCVAAAAFWEAPTTQDGLKPPHGNWWATGDLVNHGGCLEDG